MTLQQLIYFRTMARIRHFTKASEVLFISQPSLSHAMSELERELAVRLFERRGKSTSLSSQGELFLKYVESSLDKLDEGLNAIKAVHPFISKVNLGHIHSLSTSFIPAMLLGFYRNIDNKNISFNFSQSLNSGLVEALDAGTIDLAFCPKPGKETESIPVLRQDLFVIMPKDHRLAGRDEIDVRELEGEAMVMMDRKSGLRWTVEELFQDMGFTPNVTFEAEGCSSVITFVALHYGISILPIVPGLENGEVSFSKIRNPEFSREVFLAWKANRDLPPAVRRVRDFIAGHCSVK